ncbi:dihydrofolate reductase family protein [Paenibacillus thermotolerans]|uniref:dihydrofolate reductase family protein n=1 Tax=Paenibacillus thermotolerans TaxID=3027807 RepID=UPI002367A0FA|nr:MULTISPECIES: dihydrofolate reductase family protein [unclassified Paenibacillus]
MGKVILTMHMSLDGIVTNEDQWMNFSDEMLEEYVEYYKGIDRIVVGGNTYAQLAEYWQNAENSSHSDLERLIAKKINDIPKIVISRSPKELVWKNSEQVTIQDNESFVHEMRALKQRAGTISVESGLKTWQLFIQNELFDELWMFVHPVIAAQGESLFNACGKKHALQLTKSKSFSNGAIGLYYRK